MVTYQPKQKMISPVKNRQKKVFSLHFLHGYGIYSFKSIAHTQVRIFRESKCRESTVWEFSNNCTCFSNSLQLECRSGYKPRGYKFNLN